MKSTTDTDLALVVKTPYSVDVARSDTDLLLILNEGILLSNGVLSIFSLQILLVHELVLDLHGLLHDLSNTIDRVIVNRLVLA